jgi:hypothetical protein
MTEADKLTILVAAMLTGNTNPEQVIDQCVAFARVILKKIKEATDAN